MTSSGIALRRSSKAQIAQKRSWSMFGDLLPVWSTTAFWIQWNHYIWEACSANQWDALKTAIPSASTGQQKVPNSPWKHPTRCCTTNASNVEWTGLRNFASPAIFIWPLTNWWPLLQTSRQLLQGKCFHSQPDAENAFHEFVKSQSMDFYTTGINKFMRG